MRTGRAHCLWNPRPLDGGGLLQSIVMALRTDAQDHLILSYLMRCRSIAAFATGNRRLRRSVASSPLSVRCAVYDSFPRPRAAALCSTLQWKAFCMGTRFDPRSIGCTTCFENPGLHGPSPWSRSKHREPLSPPHVCRFLSSLASQQL